MRIYYLFSSVTFLQFYIPLCIEFRKRGHENVFLVRKNAKAYADPLLDRHMERVNKYAKKYNITVLFTDKFPIAKVRGIIFMIDGDIYGPPRSIIMKTSLIDKINPKQTLKISMTEHLNFMANYHKYIDKVDFSIFTNHHMIKQMKTIACKGSVIKFSDDHILDISKLNYENKKNIFLGNTKFDNIPKKEKLWKKYGLDPSKKYCLFLYPKDSGGARKNFTVSEIKNIYDHVRKLGYKIIVKIRPKDGKVPIEVRGDKVVMSDIYPNETLELLKLSDFCLMSSSSACDETIFMKVPCIDIQSDLRNYHRNSYLLDDKVYLRIPHSVWRTMSFEDFKVEHDKLDKKDSPHFDKLKSKYLFTWKNSSKKIADFVMNKYKKKFN